MKSFREWINRLGMGLVLSLMVLASVAAIAAGKGAAKKNPPPSGPTTVTKKLIWTYPPVPNIVFEVWRADWSNPRNFVLIGETVYTNWTFTATGTAAFFAVRAKNTVTGEVGDWATVGP